MSRADISKKRSAWPRVLRRAPLENVATVIIGLGFLMLRDERYDFVVPKAREERPAVRAFVDLLDDLKVRAGLAERGFARG